MNKVLKREAYFVYRILLKKEKERKIAFLSKIAIFRYLCRHKDQLALNGFLWCHGNGKHPRVQQLVAVVVLCLVAGKIESEVPESRQIKLKLTLCHSLIEYKQWKIMTYEHISLEIFSKEWNF